MVCSLIASPWKFHWCWKAFSTDARECRKLCRCGENSIDAEKRLAPFEEAQEQIEERGENSIDAEKRLALLKERE